VTVEIQNPLTGPQPNLLISNEGYASPAASAPEALAGQTVLCSVRKGPPIWTVYADQTGQSDATEYCQVIGAPVAQAAATTPTPPVTVSAAPTPTPSSSPALIENTPADRAACQQWAERCDASQGEHCQSARTS
jgi:hypothetical protein